MCKNKVVVEYVEGDVYLDASPKKKVDTVLNKLLLELSIQPIDLTQQQRAVPKIKDKITHNNLDSERGILTDYQLYSKEIESVFKRVDSNIVNGRQKILLTLISYYRKALSSLGIDPLVEDINMSVIRENADKIIRKVKRQLESFSLQSANVPKDQETIATGINVLVAYGFIECLVLEKPDDSK